MADSHSPRHRRVFCWSIPRRIGRCCCNLSSVIPSLSRRLSGWVKEPCLGGVIAFVTGWSARSVLSLPLMAMLFAADCPVHRLCHVDPWWCHSGRDIASGRRGCQLLDGCSCQPFTFRQHRELADRAGNYLLDDGWARCADMDTRLAVRSFRVAGNCFFPDANAATLHLLQLGEETAASFGVEVESSKRCWRSPRLSWLALPLLSRDSSASWDC